MRFAAESPRRTRCRHGRDAGPGAEPGAASRYLMNDAQPVSKAVPESIPHHSQGQHPAVSVPDQRYRAGDARRPRVAPGALKQHFTLETRRAEELIRREAELWPSRNLSQRRLLGDREAGLGVDWEFRHPAAPSQPQQRKMRDRTVAGAAASPDRAGAGQLGKDRPSQRDHRNAASPANRGPAGGNAVSEREQQINTRARLTPGARTVPAARVARQILAPNWTALESQTRERDAAAGSLPEQAQHAPGSSKQWSARRATRSRDRSGARGPRTRVALRSAALGERRDRQRGRPAPLRALRTEAAQTRRRLVGPGRPSKSLAAQQAGLAAELQPRRADAERALDEQGTRIRAGTRDASPSKPSRGTAA